MTIFVKMNNSKLNLGESIRQLREQKGAPLRIVAAYLDIDQAILSKIERGKRRAKRGDIVHLAKYFGINEDELLIKWLSSRILYELQDEKLAKSAIKLAEEQISYLKIPALRFSKLKKYVTKELNKYPAIKKAWLFGSFARGDESHESDIDLMIDVPEKNNFSMFDLFQIQEDLQNTFKRNFDIVLKGGLKSYARDTAKEDLKLIYDK